MQSMSDDLYQQLVLQSVGCTGGTTTAADLVINNLPRYIQDQQLRQLQLAEDPVNLNTRFQPRVRQPYKSPYAQENFRNRLGSLGDRTEGPAAPSESARKQALERTMEQFSPWE